MLRQLQSLLEALQRTRVVTLAVEDIADAVMAHRLIAQPQRLVGRGRGQCGDDFERPAVVGKRGVECTLTGKCIPESVEGHRQIASQAGRARRLFLHRLCFVLRLRVSRGRFGVRTAGGVGIA